MFAYATYIFLSPSSAVVETPPLAAHRSDRHELEISSKLAVTVESMTFSDRRRSASFDPPSPLATANTRTIPTHGAAGARSKDSVAPRGGLQGKAKLGPAQRRAHIGPLTLAESRKHPSMHLYTDSYSG